MDDDFLVVGTSAVGCRKSILSSKHVSLPLTSRFRFVDTVVSVAKDDKRHNDKVSGLYKLHYQPINHVESEKPSFSIEKDTGLCNVDKESTSAAPIRAVTLIDEPEISTEYRNTSINQDIREEAPLKLQPLRPLGEVQTLTLPMSQVAINELSISTDDEEIKIWCEISLLKSFDIDVPETKTPEWFFSGTSCNILNSNA
jgi:hypothetical protein